MALNIRKRLSNFLDPNKNSDKFYGSFLKHIGGHYTKYDTQADTYIEKGYLYNPDVYSIIQQQATKSASIPWSVKIIKDKTAKKKLDRLMVQCKGAMTPQQTIKKMQLQKKAFEEEELDFPLEKPNPLQSWSEFKALQKTFLKTTGNIYIYKPSPEDGMNANTPMGAYLLPSHLMGIVLKDSKNFQDDESPIHSYMLVEGNMYTEFNARDVIHIKYANPDYDQEGSHLYGLSPLRAALRNIQSSNEAIDNNNKTLKNSGAFGLLHSKGQTAMTADQAKELKGRLSEMDANPERLGKIAGVSMEVGFTRIALTTDELKPFDYLKFDQKTICNVLGWSDKLLNNDDGGKYDNVNQFRKQVITDNIMPDNSIIDSAIQEGFLRMFKGYENAILESVYDDLPEMQDDIAVLVSWLKECINIGIISRNEARELIRFVKSEDVNMDVITVASDIIPLSEALDTTMGLTAPPTV